MDATTCVPLVLPGKKKKFATPPVKIACLTCRASRVRCDGKEPCTGCANKGRSESECVYTKSRRGGPRRPRRTKRHDSTSEENEAGSPSSPVVQHHHLNFLAHPDDLDHTFDPANDSALPDTVPLMIDPGAGLMHLDDPFLDPDDLYDSVFSGATTLLDVPSIDSESGVHAVPDTLRAYSSNAELLDAYYTWLHVYFPILPPVPSPYGSESPVSCTTHSLPGPDTGTLQSPLALAISAVLVLVPNSDVVEPCQEVHVASRRRKAQQLVKQTLELIEADSEMPEDSITPARALAHGRLCIDRRPFHPDVPVELESTAALCILTIYEYAQRGNLNKMRDRAGHALVSAMSLSLHSDEHTNMFAEARRRIWWMTYICVCQAAIVSCTAPAISPLDPRFTTTYPSNDADPEAWPCFIQSQQTILLATQFVADLNRATERQEDLTSLCGRMQELHAVIEPLVASAENWDHSSPEELFMGDVSEKKASQSLRCMSKIKLHSARIKLHRYCAFYDIPVFTEKHCDLKEAPPFVPGPLDLPDIPQCCSTSLPAFLYEESDSTISEASSGVSSIVVSPPSSASSTTSNLSLPFDSYFPNFPFSAHISSRICLKSALSIAKTFEALPYPGVSPISGIQPRTMPSFACCAMQSAYALLMVYHKTWIMQIGDSQTDKPVHALLSQCEKGLRTVLSALDNYSMAFEAIGGMRDQVRDAVQCLPAPLLS